MIHSLFDYDLLDLINISISINVDSKCDLNYFVRKWCKSYRNKDEGHITFWNVSNGLFKFDIHKL